MKTIFTATIEIHENTEEALREGKPLEYTAVLTITDKRTEPGREQTEQMRPGPNYLDAMDRALKVLPELIG